MRKQDFDNKYVDTFSHTHTYPHPHTDSHTPTPTYIHTYIYTYFYYYKKREYRDVILKRLIGQYHPNSLRWRSMFHYHFIGFDLFQLLVSCDKLSKDSLLANEYTDTYIHIYIQISWDSQTPHHLSNWVMQKQLPILLNFILCLFFFWGISSTTVFTNFAYYIERWRDPKWSCRWGSSRSPRGRRTRRDSWRRNSRWWWRWGWGWWWWGWWRWWRWRRARGSSSEIKRGMCQDHCL